jgi:hypothetical protein
VLQAGKAKIDAIQAPSQQIVLKFLYIVGSLRSRRIEPPRLRLVKKIVYQMNQLRAGLGDFRNHKK